MTDFDFLHSYTRDKLWDRFFLFRNIALSTNFSTFGCYRKSLIFTVIRIFWCISNTMTKASEPIAK